MTPPYTNGMIGRLVHDGLHCRLGHLASLYVDVDVELDGDAGATVEPEAVRFAGVAMLRRGRRRIVFVSLAGAIVEPDCLILACGGDLVRSAPNVQTGRPLPAELEPALFAHYDVRYSPAADGVRRLVPLA